MKFFCMLPVRDEGDVIGQTLEHLLYWVDEVHVFDTGSCDDTWEIVQDMAGRDRRIFPMEKDAVYFNDTLVRAWMFDRVRKRMKEGDWFLRADGDEFHHVSPPEFVRTRLRSHETVVWHQYYNFALLESEAAAWESGQESIADRQRPISDRRRWYIPSVYSEPRLCRYRESMKWPAWCSFPFNAGYVANERLPIRHYPHRDPLQLRRRRLLRAVMMADEENARAWARPEQHHWSASDWSKFVTPDNTPELSYWAPGQSLEEVCLTSHLAKPFKRVAQRIVHAGLLPWLDSRREGWIEGQRPRRIGDAHQELLREALRL